MKGNAVKTTLTVGVFLGAAGFAAASLVGSNKSLVATGTWDYDWTNPLGAFSFTSNNSDFLNTSAPFLGETWSDASLTASFTPDGNGDFDVSFTLTAYEGDPTLSELDGTFVVTSDNYAYRNVLGGAGGDTPELGDYFVWSASPVTVTNATNGFAGLAGVDAAGSGNYLLSGTGGFMAMDYQAVPEPFAMGLAALGVGVVGVIRRRRAGNVAGISKKKGVN
jgi:hypothetical protein